MAIRTDTARESQQPSLTETVALADLAIDVPETAREASVTVRGDRSSFEIEIERRNRWLLEGALDAAELTAVYGNGLEIGKPERVPSWLEQVLGEFGIHEVTL